MEIARVEDIERRLSANDNRELDEKHRNELEASGLSPESIAASGCYSETGKEIHRLLNWPQEWNAPSRGLVYPYLGGDGYVQVKLDTPRLDGDKKKPIKMGAEHALDLMMIGGGAVEPDEEQKPIKYEKPIGIPARVYMPAIGRERIEDLNEDLWITEGEKKSLLGCQCGLAMVAVPGVTCFSDAEARKLAKGQGSTGKMLHPDLRRLVKHGRHVVLCFDNDVDKKDEIVRALAEAAKLLYAAGSEVSIAYLPRSKSKIGLDDYFVKLLPHQRGDDPLHWIKESARPANVYDVIDWLEQHWCDFTETEQTLEIERAVKLARYMLPYPKRDLPEWIKTAAKKLDVTQKSIKALIPAEEIKSGSAADDDSAREWLAAWLKVNGAKYLYRTEKLLLNGKEIPREAVDAKIALDAAETKCGFGEKLLQHALTEWICEEKAAALTKLRERIAYRPVGDTEVRRYVGAVTGAEDEIAVAVIKHFIWQVKRKLHGAPVENHLMPILHGAPGGGKSEAVKKLLAPVIDVADFAADLFFLNDERQCFRLTRSYVVFCDEMAHAEKVCIDALKNRITSDTVFWRQLSTNRLNGGTNVATFIGATNNRVCDVIYDPTGMRRFYELKCLDKLDWDAINSIDYDALWASVDHSEASPIRLVAEKLKEQQEEIRAKDPIEEWLEECCTIGGDFQRGSVLYDAFSDFQQAQGRKPWGKTKWGRRLTEITKRALGEDGVKISDGKHYRVSVKRAEPPLNPYRKR